MHAVQPRYGRFPNVASISTHTFGSRRTLSGAVGALMVNVLDFAVTRTRSMTGVG